MSRVFMLRDIRCDRGMRPRQHVVAYLGELTTMSSVAGSAPWSSTTARAIPSNEAAADPARRSGFW
jgi:hypothetical protein